MFSLDSPKWSDLHHAYGSAEDVPNLLKRLYADPTDEFALNDAWSSLCHQGTIYTASIAAAPHLVSLVINSTLRDRLGPLILVGSIAESLGKPTETLEADADFEKCSAEAVELLCESIKYGNLLDYELRHSLSALAALLGDSRLASLLSNADCGIECPKCGTEIDLLESNLVE
jgi:hypothetical protein